MLQLAVTRLCKSTRERTYGNNTKRRLSKEQERLGGKRLGGDLSGFTRLRIKTQVAKPKKYTLWGGGFERLVRLEDFEL